MQRTYLRHSSRCQRQQQQQHLTGQEEDLHPASSQAASGMRSCQFAQNAGHANWMYHQWSWARLPRWGLANKETQLNQKSAFEAKTNKLKPSKKTTAYRTCARRPTSAIPKALLCCEPSLLLFHGGDVTCFDVMKLLIGHLVVWFCLLLRSKTEILSVRI